MAQICIEKDRINVYYDELFMKNEAEYIYKELENNIEYNSNEESSIIIYGKKYYIPRLQSAYGDDGTYYKFSGHNVVAKPWIPILLYIKEKVIKYIIKILPDLKWQTYTQEDIEKMNFVLVNKYINGNHYIGYHRDAEKDLGDNPLIVSISFGATRKFMLQSVEKFTQCNDYLSGQYNNKVHKERLIELSSGSLLMLMDPTNKFWKHSIVKEPQIKESRINLTFRFINVNNKE